MRHKHLRTRSSFSHASTPSLYAALLILLVTPVMGGCPDEDSKQGDGWQLGADMEGPGGGNDQGSIDDMHDSSDASPDLDPVVVDMPEDMKMEGEDMNLSPDMDLVPDMEPRPAEPDLLILPELTFGRVTPGLSKSELLGLRNSGDEPLLLQDIALQPSDTLEFALSYPNPNAPDDPALDSDSPPGQVEPGEGFPIRVTFSPLDTRPRQASMVITSNDPDSPSTEVTLQGNLEETCLAVLGSGPPMAGSDAVAELDFGTVRTGQSSTREVRLQNCSRSRPLTLYRYMDGLDGTDFSVVSAPALDANDELIVAPLEEVVVTLAFSPTSDGAKSTQYKVTSDATATGLTTVDLRGEGTSQVCPEAIALASVMGESQMPSQTITTEPLKTIVFDGTQSVDEDGSIVSYEWSIVSAPSQSTSRLTPNPQSSQPTFFLDVAGQYVFELSVIDNSGTASCTTAQVSILATSSRALSMELTWVTPADADQTDTQGTDVDIQYKQASSLWNMVPGTIFWQNTTSDWGVMGDAGDNPSLDIDDTDGAGPEIISHDNPPEGTYNVGVYYYNDNGFGPSYATVRLYNQGLLIAEVRDKYLEREDLFWYVGDVIVDAVGTVNYVSEDAISLGIPTTP